MVSTIEQVNKQGSGAKPARKQNRFVLVCKIIAWQLAAFLLVEFCLSLAGLGEEEIYKLDPDLGVKHMSNKKVTWRSEGLASSYFNEDGLRETGVRREKAAGVYRIALLGDSLTESLQVPLEKSFGYQTALILTRKLGRPVEVINFAVSGYSTVQEYLQLKKQVLAYKPDLVLLCYNSRDCFENWSPPDEVLTNVRPAALKLPGRALLVDSSAVKQWMRTPRAKFLKQFELLREHSRLWGLFAAAEIDWSMHNETYKQLVFFLTKPGKAIRKTWTDLSGLIHKLGVLRPLDKSCQDGGAFAGSLPARSATNVAARSTSKETDSSNRTAEPARCVTSCSAPSKTSTEPAHSTAITKTATSQSHAQKKPHTPADSNYQNFIEQTMGSLLEEMNKCSSNSGARFAVIALPVRSALSSKKGVLASFNNIDYNDELIMLEFICKEKGIPYFNIHESAKLLSDSSREDLFYLIHLKPQGHDFVAKEIAPHIAPLINPSLMGSSQKLEEQAGAKP